MPVQASQQIVSELAPTGVLRAAINMGNFLLVSGKDPNGDPSGVSPDMAAAVAARLGVPVKYVPYARPGEMADDAEKGLWGIGNIGAEPQRAAVINFTAAYAEIEATYLVPAGSPIKNVGEVDQPGAQPGIGVHLLLGECLDRRVGTVELQELALFEVVFEPQPVGAARRHGALLAGLVNLADIADRRAGRHQVGRLDLAIG